MLISMLSAVVFVHSFQWVVPMFVALGSAPAYFGIWSLWRILTSVLPNRVFRKGDDFLWSFYQRCVLFCLHTYPGLEVIVYGDVEDLYRKENVLYLSNHQCAVDWAVADMLAIQQCSLGQIRYIMKEGLQFFPLYGFCFRQHSCCFVKRGKDFDQAKLKKDIAQIKQRNIPSWIVIFPEGTRYNPELPGVIEKSKQFAEDKGLKPLDHVLSPRVKALQVCRQQLSGHVTAVYDVTLAYSNTLEKITGERTAAPGMPDFMNGACKKLHIYFERIDIKDVPTDEKKLKQWLHNQYEKKERLMSQFYCGNEAERGRFPGEGKVISIQRRQTIPSFIFFSTTLVFALAFPKTRSLYWKFGLFSSLGGCLWMYLRSQ